MSLTEEQRAELRAQAERLARGRDCAALEYLGHYFLLLAEEAAEEGPPDPEPRAGRGVVETRHVGGVTLQREKVRCGKPNCRSCPHPQGNGGYWYAYFRAGGKVKSRYVGKSAAQAEAFAHPHTADGGRIGGPAIADRREPY